MGPSLELKIHFFRFLWFQSWIDNLMASGKKAKENRKKRKGIGRKKKENDAQSDGDDLRKNSKQFQKLISFSIEMSRGLSHLLKPSLQCWMTVLCLLDSMNENESLPFFRE